MTPNIQNPSPRFPAVVRKSVGVTLGALLALAVVTRPGLAQETNSTANTEGPVVELDTFVVGGIRSSFTQALDIKRQSVDIVDSIVAEDIGKFPDNNLVEALQRVTGIQVTGRASGEVSTVHIRGLPDINTTINGHNVFTASGTAVALQDIPASLLARVDVYKTRTSDQIENGIAGSINIRTHRPFDFKDSRVVVAGRAIYADQAGKTGTNISALFSKNWDTSSGKFGALLNLSYVKTPYRDQNATAGAEVPFVTDNPPANFVPYERIFPTMDKVAENPIWQAGLEEGLPATPGSTLQINGEAVPYVLSRDAVFQNDFTGTRKRPAANLTLQFAPNDSAEYTFQAFYDGYRNTSFNDLLFSFVDWWGGPLGEVTLYPGTNIVQSRASVAFPYSFSSGDLTVSDTDSYIYSLDGKWDISDAFKLTSSLAYQDSRFKSAFFAMRADRVAPSVSVNFNPGNGIVAFDFPDDPNTAVDESDLTDPSLWNIAQLYDNGNKNDGSAWTWNLDGDYTPASGFFKGVTAGVRYDDRKASESQRTQDAGSLAQPMTNFPELYHVNKDFFDGHSDVPTTWVVPDGHVIYANADMYRGLYNLPQSGDLSLFENFNVKERNIAGYVRGDFETYVGDHKLDGQVGARFVDVKTDMEFTDQGTLETSTASVSKSKLLPSASLRYNLTNDLVLRLSYAETLRRPNFNQLNPAIIYVEDVTNIGYGTATGGNPNLKPTESKNYDLALEYYFGKSSAVYATFFKRKIDGFVVDFRKRVTYQNYDYILTQPDNTSNGDLKGFELGVVYFPDNLPDALDGLGVQASYTNLSSQQDIPITNSAGEVVDVLTRDLFQVSDDSFSVVLAYEKKKFSARLSYVWRSAFLNNYEAALFANPLPVYHNPEKSLDLQLSYRVSDDITVTLDATNLTNEIFQSYYGQSGATVNNFSSSLYSRTFALGARFSF